MKKNLVLLFAIPLFFVGCDSNDDDNGIKLEQDKFVMNFKDTEQINVTSKLGITYSSESDYVASVSSIGMITAGRVGETKIVLNNGTETKNVSVIVEPKHNIYPEPIHKVKFGDSKATVKSVFGAGYKELSSGFGYLNYHKSYDYVFLFEGDKMTAAGVFIPTLSLPDNFADFLTERYQIVTLEGYLAAFINEKKDMSVGTSPTDDMSEMLIIYIPYSPTSRSANNMNIKENMLNTYKELKK